MFPDLNAFFDAAKSLKLTPVECDTVWNSLTTTMCEDVQLFQGEKEDVRLQLLAFTEEYPSQYLVPVLKLTPLTPWTGSNLFGCLQPFCI